jgi:hypothetical protein
MVVRNRVSKERIIKTLFGEMKKRIGFIYSKRKINGKINQGAHPHNDQKNMLPI